MADAKQVVCSWSINIEDNNGETLNLTFDLVDGDEPLVIGDNVLRYSNHIRLEEFPKLEIQLPRMKTKRVFHTYSTVNESRPRLRLVGMPIPTKTSMLSNKEQHKKDMAMVMKVHSYGHAPKKDIRRLLQLAGKLTESVDIAIDKVLASCEVCLKSGIPLPSRKMSISNIDKDFNVDVLVDFLYFAHGNPSHTHIYFHARCCGVGYSEVAVVPNRSMDIAAKVFDEIWINRHGSPGSVGADPEFDKSAFKKLLKANSIRWKPRPARRHNQVGMVERKNRVIKSIMQRLAIADPDATAAQLAARAAFLSNVFAGSRIASSFEMARGYTPSIAGLPNCAANQKLIQAHRARNARRALQKLLSSHKSNALRRQSLKPGRKILIFDKDEKWHVMKVSAAEPHFIVCRRHKKGPSLKVAYEDVRLYPKDSLDREILADELDDELKEATEIEDAISTVPIDEVAQDVCVDADGATGFTGEKLAEEGQPLRNTACTMQGRIEHPVTEWPEKDIRLTDEIETPSPGSKLISTKQKELEKIHKVIGHNQVHLRNLDFAAPWVTKESYAEEENNWNCVYEEVDEASVPKNANIIGSHVMYKIKVAEDNSLKLKARICAHGNEDREKDDIRKDSASAQYPVIRLACSIIALLGFMISGIDITAAFLQSGPCRREIYMRPPMEHKKRRGKIWKLVKLPYGIVEAGRQWQLASEQWLLNEAGFERAWGVSQLFIKRHQDGEIRMIVAKVTDDFLIGGSSKDIEWFDRLIRSRFEVGKTVQDGRLNFNGAIVSRESNGDVVLSMEDYFSRIEAIPISRDRRKQQEDRLNEDEVKGMKRISGQLTWIGRGAVPCASYAGSHIQQRIADARVKHLCEANSMLRELEKLDKYIKYVSPTTTVADAFVASFSDASFNVGSSRSYGQTGIVTGIAFQEGEDVPTKYHLVDWSSHKQRRVSYSSFGAEILACADADDMTHALRASIRMLFKPCGEHPIRSKIFVDSLGLWDTLTTLHECREYRLRQTVQRIRDSFEDGDLDELIWIRGIVNVADALTKRSVELQKALNKMCTEGLFLSEEAMQTHRSKSSA